MKKFKNLESSLMKSIICSILFGFLIVVVLSHVVLAFYIAKSENPTQILEYLDSEPDKSIRSGF